MSDNKNEAPLQTPPTGGQPHDPSGWARPVAQKKDRNVGAWLTLLGLVCFAIAFRGPLNRLYWSARNNIAGPPPVPAGTADCFLALSYEGVSALPDPDGVFISAARSA